MKKINWNLRKTVFLILSIAWMCVVWGFSAESDVQSGGRSLELAKYICGIFVKGYKELSLERQIDIAGRITYPIRKMAHATEYGVLGLLIAGWIVDYKRRVAELKEKLKCDNSVRKISDDKIIRSGIKSCVLKQLLISFILTVIYASSDEIHQLSVPGRSGMIRDVVIDSLGALACLIILYMIILKRSEKL